MKEAVPGPKRILSVAELYADIHQEAERAMRAQSQNPTHPRVRQRQAHRTCSALPHTTVLSPQWRPPLQIVLSLQTWHALVP
jgi:hypothetical protein